MLRIISVTSKSPPMQDEWWSDVVTQTCLLSSDACWCLKFLLQVCVQASTSASGALQLICLTPRGCCRAFSSLARFQGSKVLFKAAEGTVARSLSISAMSLATCIHCTVTECPQQASWSTVELKSLHNWWTTFVVWLSLVLYEATLKISSCLRVSMKECSRFLLFLAWYVLPLQSLLYMLVHR